MLRVAPALLLVLLASGCLDAATPADRRATDAAAPALPAMTWAPGNHWAYHAVVGNRSVDVTLVVHRATAEGFLLGTNASAGFFGLPFAGNVTRELNPRIGLEEWPLFRFPLADGASWGYRLFGHEARTLARAATVDVPGVGPSPGYTLEATAYGQLFARYDYSPHAGWFTRLELLDPQRGATILHATLTGFGERYGETYYVAQLLRETRIEYPALPGTLEVDVPSGYARVEAYLVATATTGLVEATLRGEDRRTLAHALALGQGSVADRHVAGAGARTWRLEHRGAGSGGVTLELTGLVPAS